MSTLALGAAAGGMVARPWRRATMGVRRQRWLLAVVLTLMVPAAGCGGSKPSSSSAPRPTTTARIQLTAPTPNEITNADPVVKVHLIGGTVVQRTTGKLTPTEGHIHLTLDGKLVSMAYKDEQQLNGLKPGPHAIEAEFVAVDHQPFANRPKAAVLFEVQ